MGGGGLRVRTSSPLVLSHSQKDPHVGGPSLFRKLKAVATDLEIPVQVEVAAGGTGTDANAMQITREGIPTALLSIPLRNMHTPIETLAVKDIERTGRLLAHFIARLDDTFMDTLDWEEAEEESDDS